MIAVNKPKFCQLSKVHKTVWEHFIYQEFTIKTLNFENNVKGPKLIPWVYTGIPSCKWAKLHSTKLLESLITVLHSIDIHQTSCTEEEIKIEKQVHSLTWYDSRNYLLRVAAVLFLFELSEKFTKVGGLISALPLTTILMLLLSIIHDRCDHVWEQKYN